MTRRARPAVVQSVALLAGLAGCDSLFGLPHIPDRTDAGVRVDGSFDAGPCPTQRFTDPRDYPTGAMPLGIAVADIDGDTKLDILTANQMADTVSVLLGVGDGTFAPKQDFDTAMGPTGLAIGDFDDDGMQDVAVAEFGTNLVSVFSGTGGGSFGMRKDYVLTAATDVALLPVAGNKPDLAAVGGAKLSRLTNNGSGSFGIFGYADVGDGAYDVHIDDFNRDGMPDFVTANITASNVSTGIAIDSAGFAVTDIPMAMRPRVAVTGRIDGDVRVDIAVVSAETGMMTVLLNLDGTHFVPGSTASVAGTPIGLAIGDLDVDGDNDLAVANTNQDTLTVLANDGDGHFGQDSVVLPAGVTPAELVIADFDRDARNDIALVNRTSGNVRVYLGCPH